MAKNRHLMVFSVAALAMVLGVTLLCITLQHTRKISILESEGAGSTNSLVTNSFDHTKTALMQLLRDEVDFSLISSSELHAHKGNKKGGKKKRKSRKKSPKAKKSPKKKTRRPKIPPAAATHHNYILPNYAVIEKGEFTYSSGATEHPDQIVVEDWRHP